MSQIYSFKLKKPFAKTILEEFEEWYLEAHRGQFWKRKYLQLKTGKKLSEKLLWVLLIHLTEFQLSPQETLRNSVLVEFAKWYLEVHRGLLWKKKYLKIKTEKKLFWETALCWVNTSHRVTALPSRSLSLKLFLWNLQSVVWKPIEGSGDKGNILR